MTSRQVVGMVLVMVALLAAGCPIKHEKTVVRPDCTPEKPAAGSVGSWDNPVRCDMPRGELAYLDRLRGPDGEPVRYYRTGNMGQGVNGNIVDRYLVQSADGSVCKEVIMDMYYPRYVEDRAVEGFTIVVRG
jgi:hypothetical protein